MDRANAVRNLGVLDHYFAPHVVKSKLSDKVKAFTLTGSNPDIDTPNIEDVWNVGGRLTYMNTGQQLVLVSTSAQDAPGGTGITEVIITGLDFNYNLTTEIIVLNGLTSVTTNIVWVRVHSIVGQKPGASDPNTTADGNITISDNTGGALTQAQITAGTTASSATFFTVPKGFTGFIDQVVIAGGPNDDFILHFGTRRQNDVFVSSEGFVITNSNVHDVVFDPKLVAVNEFSDIKFFAQAINNNVQVRMLYTITLIENNYLDSLVSSL